MEFINDLLNQHFGAMGPFVLIGGLGLALILAAIPMMLNQRKDPLEKLRETALRRMQEAGVPPGKRVLGVFVPLIEALTERQWGDNSPPREVAVKHVALFATPATVASRAFQRELAFRAIGVDVEAQACGGVVDAIEDGDMILAEALVRSHVDALKRKMPRPEAAILGCTHYPLMQQVFQDALGPEVQVYSQANLVAESLADYLARRPDMLGSGQEDAFLTTGDPRRVSDRATQFLRRQITFRSAG